jgi:hypothetical protein
MRLLHAVLQLLGSAQELVYKNRPGTAADNQNGSNWYTRFASLAGN